MKCEGSDDHEAVAFLGDGTGARLGLCSDCIFSMIRNLISLDEGRLIIEPIRTRTAERASDGKN